MKSSGPDAREWPAFSGSKATCKFLEAGRSRKRRRQLPETAKEHVPVCPLGQNLATWTQKELLKLLILKKGRINTWRNPGVSATPLMSFHSKTKRHLPAAPRVDTKALEYSPRDLKISHRLPAASPVHPSVTLSTLPHASLRLDFFSFLVSTCQVLRKFLSPSIPPEHSSLASSFKSPTRCHFSWDPNLS